MESDIAMKVIVTQSGFYAGDWFESSNTPVEMKEDVAKQFLPPFGNALKLPKISKQSRSLKNVDKV